MKFGVQLPHFGRLASGEDTVHLARRAEALGLDSVWVGDHVIYPPAYAERFGDEFYEAVTTLSFVAAHTSTIALGTAVLVLPYRQPILLAKQLATLAALGGNRLIVGVGAGWLEEEHKALGASFAGRGGATDESLRLLRTLWTDSRPLGMLFAPRPTPPPALWVGGDTPRALRRAAELGDGWLPIWHAPTGRGFTPAALRERVQELGRLRARAGRSGAGEVAALMPLAITARPPAGEPQPLVGTSQAIVEMLHRYGEAGLGHVVLSPYYGLEPALLPARIEDVEALLETFVADVRRRL